MTLEKILVAASSWRFLSASPFPFEMAFIATLKNPHPQPVLTTLVAMLPPLVGPQCLCGLQPLLRLHHHCCRCNAAAAATTVIVVVLGLWGRQTKDNASVVIFKVFQEDDESLASEGGMILH